MMIKMTNKIMDKTIIFNYSLNCKIDKNIKFIIFDVHNI